MKVFLMILCGILGICIGIFIIVMVVLIRENIHDKQPIFSDFKDLWLFLFKEAKSDIKDLFKRD